MDRNPYNRVLIKLSGEALQGGRGHGIDPAMLDTVCKELVEVASSGIGTAVVVGAGNIFRGLGEQAAGMDRVTADYMGMLATVINAMALADTLNRLGADARAMSAFEIKPAVETYVKPLAASHLEQGRIVVLAAGTGNPFFSTDTAAALRALELGARVLVKATKVDGVYDSDPATNPDAKRFDALSYSEVIERRLKVMDLTAVALCQENDLPIVVCNLLAPGNMKRLLVHGEKLGTAVGSG